MQPTNPNQFTEKAWAAIARSPDIVKQAQQQQIESEHLLQALLEADGLATQIFKKAEVDVQRLRDRTTEFIHQQAKLKTPSESIFLGTELRSQLLDRADNHRKKFKDDFISIEHLVLAYTQDDRFGKALLKDVGLDEPKLRAVIEQIRGNQTVTDQNPEGKYESLEKYGRDLTELGPSGQARPCHWPRWTKSDAPFRFCLAAPRTIPS